MYVFRKPLASLKLSILTIFKGSDKKYRNIALDVQSTSLY
jgi:hypothetical protein